MHCNYFDETLHSTSQSREKHCNLFIQFCCSIYDGIVVLLYFKKLLNKKNHNSWNKEQNYFFYVFDCLSEFQKKKKKKKKYFTCFIWSMQLLNIWNLFIYLLFFFLLIVNRNFISSQKINK